ncbi:MAG: RimK-like ATPgrasp N-terminal domain-containing protein [Candidatus Tectomicrobia bacterium]|uniref:RimK-like ATPgrasp N-terminal domain-containing protein n=1 Tax=Tectimicrobiota bacterium TaxID=2528274 RepID=A0A932HYH2_UNCTE|nr:RimK-like ATPgrasp N-terminal domain-containing protein [Candidatus Tectomicrobia bacterium]
MPGVPAAPGKRTALEDGLIIRFIGEKEDLNGSFPRLATWGEERLAGNVAYCPEGGFFVNLAGDYNYIEAAYYVSQDIEAEGRPVHPTCQEMLDAYVPPLFLEKARLAGLPVPNYYVTNDFFEPPVIVDTINPFMYRQMVVLKEGMQRRVAKSLTRNFTYAICCQELPERAKVAYFRCVMGECGAGRFREAARRFWEAFRLPLAEVRVILAPGGEILLSGVDPLPWKKLTPRERARLNRRVQWPG